MSRETKTYPTGSVSSIVKADEAANIGGDCVFRMVSRVTSSAINIEQLVGVKKNAAGEPFGQAEKEAVADVMLVAMLMAVSAYAAAGASISGKLFDAEEFGGLARRIATETAAMQGDVETSVAGEQEVGS